MRVSAMVRAALFVQDMERSTRFYRDILGLSEVYFDSTLDQPVIPQLLGVDPSTITRARILQVPGPSFGMVGLFELMPRPEPIRKVPGKPNVGEVALVFYCADIDTLVSRLELEGVTWVCRPVPYVSAKHGFAQREMSFYDPDGVFVNIIERDEQL
jgi:catechol 2,3-dioxygenase-like lactoylglutathione lyase family enzyme